MIVIDGSFGEGGGQVLRTSLALSIVTGKAFRIENIRAKRKKTGLQRQHLTAVNAAVQICDASAEGNVIGSGSLFFKPGKIRPGNYRFAVGSAGSCTLVLQAILPALVLADRPSELVLEGGTHNPMAPPFDFLARSFLPVLNRMGARVSAALERPGFYPAGGGRFTVKIEPTGSLKEIDLVERGELRKCLARAVVSRIPVHVAHRELKLVQDRLSLGDESLLAEEVESSGPGNFLTVEVESENITEVFTGFGERGVRAEVVAEDTVEMVLEYLASGVPVGRNLADQLLVPMALAGGGRFRTLPPTMHTTTNIEVIRNFLDVRISARECENKAWEIGISG